VPGEPSFAPDDFGRLGTVRLGATLAFGPSVSDVAFLSLLLAEDGAALVVRDGVTIERWDVSGPSAVRTFSVDAGSYPFAARADVTPGSYLVALGYGGLAVLP
jgi:hypothetical protein